MFILKFIFFIFCVGAFIALFCVSSIADIWRALTGSGKKAKSTKQETAQVREEQRTAKTKRGTDLRDVKDVEYHKIEE